MALHRLLRGSSLVVEEGGGNHGVTLGGNDCLDDHLAAYLATGTVPRAKDGAEVDAVCEALPEPEPEPLAAAGKKKATEKSGKRVGALRAEATGITLHGLLGHVR